jgi:hypothetical protein
MKTKLPTISDKDFTSKVLEATLNLTQAVTGIAVSNRKDFVLSGSRIFQSAINRNFLQTLKSEWDSYKQKGRIEGDYEGTEQHHACFQEMLDFLDNDLPDKIRFGFMKKIFLTASTEEVLDRDSVLPQQYMRICRSLSSGEVIVLTATFKIYKSGEWKADTQSAVIWLEKVARVSGLKHIELVGLHERSLMDKALLTPRQAGDKSGIVEGKYCRLTKLAIDIYSFIEAYEA